MRPDGRQPDELRPIEIATGYLKTAEGSALITVGNTQVLCAASVETTVPPFLRNTGKGWVTAEWGVTAGNRRARYYRLTPEGRKQLARELSQFQRVFGAISRVIQTA